MMSNEVPIEIRELEEMMSVFTYRNGLDISRVFDDFLSYIIHFFTPKAKPLEGWKYEKEQTNVFLEMFREWIKIMDKQLIRSEWYDAFGELYMAVIAGKSRQQRAGQFFTPIHICNLMADVSGSSEKYTGKNISDPTCGSGRTLLSWHVRNIGNYLCAEDIDRTCCLMTVCNFIIHGCVGEVIWHDSLDPDSFYAGWKINEHLNTPSLSPIPLITVREITQQESVTFHVWDAKRQTNIETKEARTISAETIQLSLF